jgi:hypothetical protein
MCHFTEFNLVFNYYCLKTFITFGLKNYAFSLLRIRNFLLMCCFLGRIFRWLFITVHFMFSSLLLMFVLSGATVSIV